MTYRFRVNFVLALNVISIALLIIGISTPVITIHANLVSSGALPIIMPGVMKSFGGEDLDKLDQTKRAAMEKEIEPMIASILLEAEKKDVYFQERTILGSIQSLYANGAWIPATLISIFSVGIPVAKILLSFSSMLYLSASKRRSVIKFINVIGKWSMADVFVVAILVVYLAAKASDSTMQAIAFKSEFGIGIYIFACYCILSMIAQQFAQSLLLTDDPPPERYFSSAWQSIAVIVASIILIAFLPKALSNERYNTVNESFALIVAWAISYAPGLIFCVLAIGPLALKLKNGIIKCIVAVAYCTSVYWLMVHLAIRLDIWSDSPSTEVGEFPILSGLVSGSAGFLLTVLGLSRLLNSNFAWRDIGYAVVVCGLAGIPITRYAAYGFIHHALIWDSPLEQTLFFGGYIVWQVTTIVVIVRGFDENRKERSFLNQKIYDFSYNFVLLTCAIFIVLCFGRFVSGEQRSSHRTSQKTTSSDSFERAIP